MGPAGSERGNRKLIRTGCSQPTENRRRENTLFRAEICTSPLPSPTTPAPGEVSPVSRVGISALAWGSCGSSDLYEERGAACFPGTLPATMGAGSQPRSGRLCDPGRITHLSEPSLPHLPNGENRAPFSSMVRIKREVQLFCFTIS